VVFRRIVEERRDGLVLRAAVVEDDRGDAHEVAHIRAARSLARLRAVNLVRVSERFIELTGQLRHARSDRRLAESLRSL
jgi:hypothetical protein